MFWSVILVCPCILDVETTCNIFRFGRQMRSPEPTSTHCSDVLPGDQPCCTWDAIKSPTIASISNPTVPQSTNIISLQIYLYVYILYKTSSATSPFLDSSCKKDCSQANQPMFGFGQHPSNWLPGIGLGQRREGGLSWARRFSVSLTHSRLQVQPLPF